MDEQTCNMIRFKLTKCFEEEETKRQEEAACILETAEWLFKRERAFVLGE